MGQAYADNKLYSIAGDNYRVLSRYCAILDDEGYWDRPALLLNRTIYEMLNIYVQSVLVQTAVNCKKFGLEERRFIASIGEQNILGVDPEGDILDKVISDAERMVKSPPILIQLCGLRDKEKCSSLTGLFFDALMNIMLSMSYLNGSQSTNVIKYITKFYNQIDAFMYDKQFSGVLVDEKYIFRKLCVGDLEFSAKHLEDAGDDFERYKRLYLFYKDENLKKAAVAKPVKASQVKTDIKKEEVPTEAETAVLPVHKDMLEQLLEELNALVGLEEVKKEINSLINLIKVRKLRERYALPDMDMSYHMVFSGSPGTGKTTVARLVASIYKELGLLSKGILVETDRAGMVAGYVGQTALKVKDVVESAIGGVLFIDEAYTLTSSNSGNDFGQEALDTLVKMMEDHRDDLVVIVAGYTDEMKAFLKANTGLVSRFNRFIEFPDYSLDELMEIFQVMADKAGFWVEDDAVVSLRSRIMSMSEAEHTAYGNARGIRNSFERIVVNQANRVVMYDKPTIQQLSTIQVSDCNI